MEKDRNHIFILSGAYDDQYLRTRVDNPITCTSAGKRVYLYKAIEEAAGKPAVLLSPQPRGRGTAKALSATASRFGDQVQLFAQASGVRKIRFVLDMLHYARHVARHTRTGDVLIIDNFELIYVLAIQFCRLLGRRYRILLEYEDGKHLIDKGIWRRMSGFAEWLAKPWLEGAIIATPNLAERLPSEIPKVLVPGILQEGIVFNPPPAAGQTVAFLYSGSIDAERGGPLLISYLEKGNFPPGIEIHITGQGLFTDRFLAVQNRFPKTIHFHGIVSQGELSRLRGLCHYGLNLQSSSNPISNVTYPSKTFDYMNAGLRVISTRAAGVEDVLGNSAIYLKEDTIEGMGNAILTALQHIRKADAPNVCPVMQQYSFDGTCRRLAPLFAIDHPGRNGTNHFKI